MVMCYVCLFIRGAGMGSFLCCQARRLRLKEKKKKSPGRRSACLKCGKKLKWYDNVPIISWLVLHGRCRYCRKKIGVAEILAEVGMGLAFLLAGIAFIMQNSAATVIYGDDTALLDAVDTVIYQSGYGILTGISGINWGIFVMTLLLILNLGFLAIYDGAYGELPSLCLTFSGICAIILVGLKVWRGFLVGEDVLALLLNTLAAVAVLGGIYLVLYLVSKGKWVGNGDWILSGIIGMALGQPYYALIALSIANFSACLIMAPFMKKRKSHEIYFGPFLVMAFVITLLFMV